jgi:hypothetical protein
VAAVAHSGKRGRFLFLHGTMIRHALPPGTVTATSVSMQGATARARLIASASFSLMVAAGFLCAGSNAVDLAAVASSTDKNLRVAATTQKHRNRTLPLAVIVVESQFRRNGLLFG